MFKKLFLVLILVLVFAIPALACVVPVNTTIWGFVGPGGQMQKMVIIKEMPVIFHSAQPGEDMLESFNATPLVVEDWSDGKVVTALNGMNFLVHEKDIKCE